MQLNRKKRFIEWARSDLQIEMTLEALSKLQTPSRKRAWVAQNFNLGKLSVWLISALASVPIFAVLFALITSRPELWVKLWETTLPDYIGNSLLLMGLTGLAVLLIGTLTAWCVTMLEFPGRKLLSLLLILPLASPAYIVGYVYVDLLDFYGPLQSTLRSVFGWERGDYNFPAIRTLPGAAFILTIVLYPYVYLMARAAFSHQSQSQWHAARSLGLSPIRAFWQVAMPAARPGIIAGLALVLMETLSDFGVADYFGIPTLSTGIFRNWLAGGDRDAAMKLAAIMLLVVFILILLEAWNRKGRSETHGKAAHHAAKIQLTRRQSWYVAAFCALPVLLGFIIPMIVLAINTIRQTDAQTQERFLTYATNSLSVAGIVAIIAVLISAPLAYQQRADSGRLTKVGIRIATLGYALPGALLAVGLLVPLGILDLGLTRWAKNTLSWDGGLLLSGTIALLVYALVVRFLTVSFNALSSGFEKIPQSMDAAARSLGADPTRLMSRVHFPLLSQSLLVAGILVFIDVLRELPATLILRPFNFETLATRVYWLASDERLVEASSASLLIIIFGLIPVILLNRRMHD